MTLIAQLIDEDIFAPYGTLLARMTANGSQPLSPLLKSRCPSASLSASMLRAAHSDPTWSILRLERHPNAVQLFVPLDVERYLVVVARGDTEPDLDTLKAFIVPGDVGLGYGMGVWHVPMMALDRPGTFLVLMHRSTPEQDEEWHTLTEAVEVALID